MLECFIKSNRNAEVALNSYSENFPERRQPTIRYFAKLVKNLRLNGSFEKPRPKKYAKDNDNRNDQIVNYFNDNPTSSTRKCSREINLPRTTVLRTLKTRKYHPYKPIIVQGLHEGDFQRRIEFCNWYVHKCEENAHFSNNVIWTDETYLRNCGIFNKQNYHHWARENPSLRAQRRLQTRFGVNVWCGIYGKNIRNLKPFTIC